MAEKIKNTYRTGTQTPDEITEYISDGIIKCGSFPKFVDALVQELLDYKKDSEKAEQQANDTAKIINNNEAILEFVKLTREEVQSSKTEIISLIEQKVKGSDTPRIKIAQPVQNLTQPSVPTTVSLPVLGEQNKSTCDCDEIKTIISAFIDSMNEKIPSAVATKQDINTAVEQQSTAIIDANIKKIDEIIEYLKDMDLTTQPIPVISGQQTLPFAVDMTEKTAANTVNDEIIIATPIPRIEDSASVTIPSSFSAEDKLVEDTVSSAVAAPTTIQTIPVEETIVEEIVVEDDDEDAPEITVDALGEGEERESFLTGLASVLSFDVNEDDDDDFDIPMVDINEEEVEIDDFETTMKEFADTFNLDIPQEEKDEETKEEIKVNDEEVEDLLAGFKAIFG